MFHQVRVQLALTLAAFALVGCGKAGHVARPTETGSGWARSVSGLPGGSYCPAFASVGGTHFVSTFSGGVHRSEDDGLTWVPCESQPTGPVNTLFADGAALLAGTRRGVWRSTDRGRSWRPTVWPTGVSVDVRCLATNGGVLLAGTNGSGVLLSIDGGHRWALTRAQPDNRSVHALSGLNGTVVAGTNGGGIYRSTDAGLHWSAADVQPDLLVIGSIRQVGGVFLAGTTGTGLESGLYRSSDGGRTWRSPFGLPWGRGAAGFATSGADVFTLRIDGRIYRSSDQGRTWQFLSRLPLPVGAQGSAITVVGGTVLAGSTSAGVFRSADGGVSWQGAATQPQNPFPWALEASGSVALVSFSGRGLHRSLDGGLHWAPAPSSPAPEVTALHGSGSTWFAGIPGGVARSEDAGASWRTVPLGVLGDQVTAFGQHEDVVLAGMMSGGIYRSVDAGMHWTATASPGVGSVITSIATSGPVWLAGTVVGVTQAGAILRSTDAGATWTLAAPLTGSATAVYSLACDGTTFWAGGLGRVSRSDDGGTSWVEAPGLRTSSAITSLLLHGPWLVAGSAEGVYRSSDRGEHWITDSPRPADAIMAGLVSQGASVLALTESSGVWRLALP